MREHYYDMFKQDLSFNGTKDLKCYGCVETNVYCYQHTCKSIFDVSDKKTIFTLSVEKGELGNRDSYVEFEISPELFKIENQRVVLEFMRKCIYDITTRNFNLVLSQSKKIKFIHVPYDRQIRRGQYSDDKHISYTNQEFINFMSLLYDNQYFYIHYISDVILKRLTEDELNWLEYMKKMGEDFYFEGMSTINIGPELSYVRVKK